jgi:arsenate reductase-like glutaredoxin family protein
MILPKKDMDRIHEYIANHETKPAKSKSYRFMNPTTSNLWANISWVPGKVMITGDVNDVIITHYHSCARFHDAILWLRNSDVDYLLHKSSAKRIPDDDAIIDFIVAQFEDDIIEEFLEQSDKTDHKIDDLYNPIDQNRPSKPYMLRLISALDDVLYYSILENDDDYISQNAEKLAIYIRKHGNQKFREMIKNNITNFSDNPANDWWYAFWNNMDDMDSAYEMPPQTWEFHDVLSIEMVKNWATLISDQPMFKLYLKLHPIRKWYYWIKKQNKSISKYSRSMWGKVSK